MTQQANLEPETARRPPAVDAAPAETKDKAAPKVEMGKDASVERPGFYLNVPFHIDPTTDVDMIERVFAVMAEHRWPINLQIHIDPSSSPELIHNIAASMERHFYGDKP